MRKLKKAIVFLRDKTVRACRILRNKQAKSTILVSLVSMLSFFGLKTLYIIIILFVSNDYTFEIKTEYLTGWKDNLFVSFRCKNAKVPVNVKYRQTKITFTTADGAELIKLETGAGCLEKGRMCDIQARFTVKIVDNIAFMRNRRRGDSLYVNLETEVKPRISGIRFPFWKSISKTVELKSNTEGKGNAKLFTIKDMNIHTDELRYRIGVDIEFAKNRFPRCLNVKHKPFLLSLSNPSLNISCGGFEIVSGDFREPMHFEFEIDNLQGLNEIGKLMQNNYAKKPFSINFNEQTCLAKCKGDFKLVSCPCIFNQLFNNLQYDFEYPASSQGSGTNVKFAFTKFIGNKLFFDVMIRGSTVSTYFNADSSFRFDNIGVDLILQEEIFGAMKVNIGFIPDSLVCSCELTVSKVEIISNPKDFATSIFRLHVRSIYGDYIAPLNANFNMMGHFELFGIKRQQETKPEETFVSHQLKTNHILREVANGIEISSVFGFGVGSGDICFMFKKDFEFTLNSDFYTVRNRIVKDGRIFISKENNKGIEKLRGHLQVVTLIEFEDTWFEDMHSAYILEENTTLIKFITQLQIKLNNEILLTNDKKGVNGNGRMDIKIKPTGFVQKKLSLCVRINDINDAEIRKGIKTVVTLKDDIKLVASHGNIIIEKGDVAIFARMGHGFSLKTDDSFLCYCITIDHHKFVTPERLEEHLSEFLNFKLPCEEKFSISKAFVQIFNLHIKNERCKPRPESVPIFDCCNINVSIIDKSRFFEYHIINVVASLPVVEDVKTVARINIPSFAFYFSSIFVVTAEKLEFSVLENGAIAFTNLNIKVHTNHSYPDLRPIGVFYFLFTQPDFDLMNPFAYQEVKNEGSAVLLLGLETRKAGPDKGRLRIYKVQPCPVDMSLAMWDFDYRTAKMESHIASMKKGFNTFFRYSVKSVNIDVELKGMTFKRKLIEISNDSTIHLQVLEVCTQFHVNLLGNESLEAFHFKITTFFSDMKRKKKTTNCFVAFHKLASHLIFNHSYTTRVFRLLRFNGKNNIFFMKLLLPFDLEYKGSSHLFLTLSLNNQHLVIDPFPRYNVFGGQKYHQVAVIPSHVNIPKITGEDVANNGGIDDFLKLNIYCSSGSVKHYFKCDGELIKSFTRFYIYLVTREDGLLKSSTHCLYYFFYRPGVIGIKRPNNKQARFIDFINERLRKFLAHFINDVRQERTPRPAGDQ